MSTLYVRTKKKKKDVNEILLVEKAPFCALTVLLLLLLLRLL